MGETNFPEVGEKQKKKKRKKKEKTSRGKHAPLPSVTKGGAPEAAWTKNVLN